jgi:Flp pilus assembly protein TadD
MTWNVTPSRDEIGFLTEASVMYRDSGRFNQAREILTGLRALLPQNDSVAVLLGTVSFHQGAFDAAERHYREALELNPRSAYAFAHLGELAIFRKDKAQAETCLKEAIRLDPRGVYGTLARRLLDMGAAVQYEEADK